MNQVIHVTILLLQALFTANVFFYYGFDLLRGKNAAPLRHGPLAIIFLALAVSFVAATVYLLQNYLLVNVRLGQFYILFYFIIVSPLMLYLARLLGHSRHRLLKRSGELIEQSMASCLVVGILLLYVGTNQSLALTLASSFVAVLGYGLASSLLLTISQRLELANVPRIFVGKPILFISAGLIAMALMSLNFIFM